jgi:hypothetical protein
MEKLTEFHKLRKLKIYQNFDLSYKRLNACQTKFGVGGFYLF